MICRQVLRVEGLGFRVYGLGLGALLAPYRRAPFQFWQAPSTDMLGAPDAKNKELRQNVLPLKP